MRAKSIHQNYTHLSYIEETRGGSQLRWPLREGESEAYTVERWVEAELHCASVLGRFLAVIIRDRVTSSLSRGETNSSVL
jgi:hypothetical protein